MYKQVLPEPSLVGWAVRREELGKTKLWGVFWGVGVLVSIKRPVVQLGIN